MKQRLRLFKRGKTFYCEDTEAKRQTSLGTSNKTEAVRLLEIKRQSLGNPSFPQLLLRTCASVIDPRLATRTWNEAIDQMSANRKESTRKRTERAFAGKAFKYFRNKKIIETTAADLLDTLRDANTSTHHYLRRLHNLAHGLGWLPQPILAPKLWPKVRHKVRRAISEGEHQRIIATESNEERKLFYELLWEIGAAQSDAAALSHNNLNWETRTLSYQRMKTGTWSHLQIGETLDALLRKLPAEGPFFPTLSTLSANDRAAEFYRRCKILNISGVSLHSYRYAWAERAVAVGYPERFAQLALGHNSKAVHRAYAKGAQVVIPSLDDYMLRKIA